MTTREIPVSFDVDGDANYGIIHLPETCSKCGVLIVVGGPQYRVGSHRQFVLLARFLTRNGVPVMRFDYRGMGDSEGEMRTFESVENDLRTAIDVFYDQAPELEGVVIWGLCDAASAASFYAHTDNRVNGLILLNPWVRTDSGIAKAYLKYYYFSRIVKKDFWMKVFQGNLNVVKSLKYITSMIAATMCPDRSQDNMNVSSRTDNVAPSSLPERMYAGLSAYKGPLLFILSGDDLTANEFREVVKNSQEWQSLMNESRVKKHELAEANHTYSKHIWRDQVAEWTLKWLLSRC